jgi:hypothetical protein
MKIIQSIQNRIYEIRGERVMLDKDLAALYGTETKTLNLSVRRNIARFPADFMFQITKEEFEGLRIQYEQTEASDLPLTVQHVDPKGWGGSRYLPYAFTEQGVAMLSGILNSDRAIAMNIAIMRAFVGIRRILIKQQDVTVKLDEIKNRLEEHDAQLNQIFDAMENILDEKASERKWDERERIGFKFRK